MLKKFSFIISSTVQAIFKNEESFTINSVLRNAKKSELMYDGMYHITEELLKIADGTATGNAIALAYVTPMNDGEGEEMHLFIILRRKLFYFTKTDDPDTLPQKELYKDYEAPILLQLEFVSRKQLITVVNEQGILITLDSLLDVPEKLQPEWKKLIDFAIHEISRFLPQKVK